MSNTVYSSRSLKGCLSVEASQAATKRRKQEELQLHQQRRQLTLDTGTVTIFPLCSLCLPMTPDVFPRWLPPYVLASLVNCLAAAGAVQLLGECSGLFDVGGCPDLERGCSQSGRREALRRQSRGGKTGTIML